MLRACKGRPKSLVDWLWDDSVYAKGDEEKHPKQISTSLYVELLVFTLGIYNFRSDSKACGAIFVNILINKHL